MSMIALRGSVARKGCGRVCDCRGWDGLVPPVVWRLTREQMDCKEKRHFDEVSQRAATTPLVPPRPEQARPRVPGRAADLPAPAGPRSTCAPPTATGSERPAACRPPPPPGERGPAAPDQFPDQPSRPAAPG